MIAKDTLTLGWIANVHYKFFYQPLHQTHSAEEYILLDILFEESHYREVVRMPIHSPFLRTEGEAIGVGVPSKEDILGDKLTAFAPSLTI